MTQTSNMNYCNLKTVVIGTGRMGRRHIQVVQELGLDLVGVFDKQRESLDLAAKERKLPPEKLFSDATTMFRTTTPECVIVATTADSHHSFTCQAAEAGAKYILCEKPMAISLGQCDEMIRVCAKHSARLAINHQNRVAEVHQTVKRMLQSEQFGGMTSITVVAGNCGVAMIGTHMFELFSFMTEEAPHEVTAFLFSSDQPNPRGAQFDDPGGTIRISTKSGKRFYMDAGVDQGHGLILIHAAKYGQIVLDALDGSVRNLRRQDADRNLPSTRYGTPSVRTLIENTDGDVISETKAILEGLLNGGTPTSGEDGRQAVAVLVAAYVSNESGHCPVRVDDPALPRERAFPWP